MIQRRAPWVDVVVGTHALPHLLELLKRSRDGRPADGRPGVHRDVPERPAGRRGTTPSARGCRSRPGATTRARSASCRWCAVRSARARSATSSPRCRGSRAAASSRSPCSVRTSTRTGATSRCPGSSATSAVRRAAATRSARSTGSGGSGSRRPHPHDFTPDVIEAMARDADGLRAHPLPAAVRLGPGAEGDAALLPAGALPGLARARSARRSPTIAVSTDVIVGFPGETEEDFAADPRGRRASRGSTAPSCSSTRRGRARAPRRSTIRSPRRSCRSGSTGSMALQERIVAASARARRSARTSRSWWRAADKKGRSTQARTRTNRIVHLPDAAGAGHVRRRPDHRRRRAPPHGRGRAGARRRRASERHCTTGGSRRSPSSDPRRPARPRRRSSWPRRWARRSLSVDSMLVYRGMDIGTAKPTPAERAAGAAPPDRPRRAVRAVQRGPVPGAAAGGARRDRDARARRRCWSGGSGLYFRAVVDDLSFPGTDPDDAGRCWSDEAARAGRRAPVRRLAAIDPVAAAQDRAGERAPDGPGAGGGGRSPAARSASFADGLGRATRPSACGRPGSGCAARGAGDADRARGSPRCSTAGWLEEVRGLVERGFGEWLTSTQAIGYAELAASPARVG